jgi:hypothetical protein
MYKKNMIHKMYIDVQVNSDDGVDRYWLTFKSKEKMIKFKKIVMENNDDMNKIFDLINEYKEKYMTKIEVQGYRKKDLINQPIMLPNFYNWDKPNFYKYDAEFKR